MLDQPILHEEFEFLTRVAGSIVTSEDLRLSKLREDHS